MKGDTLDEVYTTYKALDDSLRVTKRIVESSNQRIRALHKGTLFWGKRTAEFEPQMVSIVSEFNDIMVLALFAANESVERWPMTDMLMALLAVR